MSNQAVGSVYQTIMDDVINSSRVDFEESGVEEGVLEELRRGWQLKLSQLDVARFPWEPKPEPPPAPAAPALPPQPIPPTQTQAQFTPQPPLPAAEPIHGLPAVVDLKPEPALKPEPGSYIHIKHEPGTGTATSPPTYQNHNPKDMGNVAHARAAHLLEQYGPRAAGSINAIQNHVSQQHGVSQHQQQQQQQQQLQQPLNQQMQQGQPQPQPQPPLSHAQTDGAGDASDDDHDGHDDENLQAVLLRRGITGNVEELGRVEVDRILHDQIAAKARSMEGGGLMLSLKEATKQTAAPKAPRKSKGKERAIAPYDGGDDDDDIIDEDAINSDLDDSDEPGEEDEVDDEGLGHIMLCMYDKVQRVKNKWKCTLKDGILTVNGKEYVFGKATGEYEW